MALTRKMPKTESRPEKTTQGNHSSDKALHVIVHGRVQGVFFRSGLKNECDKLGIRGWVRNQPDGSVEALLQGKDRDLEKAVEWCKQGPERAEVKRVESHEIKFQNILRNFEIVY